MSPNVVGEVSLQEESIKRNGKLLINPDNVFWALISAKNSATSTPKILSLYTKFKDKLDAAMREFRFKIALNSVYINPTDRCNADCPYCYIPASKRKYGKSMNDTQLIYILRKIDKYFTNYRKKYSAKPIIIYHGSEPLLMKGMLFSSIVKFNKKFHFGIQTNAILLEKKDVEFLKSYNVSTGISFDSLDPKINNYTRKAYQGSNHDKAIQAIEWFNGYEGLNVITTITRYNVKNLSELVHFLHEKRVPCVLLNPVRATRSSTLKLRPEQKVLT
jgi:uncharacterized protein